jgi:hypothetical protein
MVRQGYVGDPLSAYVWAILLAIINPWWAYLSSTSTFSFSPIKSLRDGIFKLLRRPGINSKELIPPACAGIFEQSMEAGNRVGIGLSYRHARLQRRGIDSLESIPWLLKGLKIRSLAVRRYDNPTLDEPAAAAAGGGGGGDPVLMDLTRFLASIDCSKIPAQVLGRGSTGIPKFYTLIPEQLFKGVFLNF